MLPKLVRSVVYSILLLTTLIEAYDYIIRIDGLNFFLACSDEDNRGNVDVSKIFDMREMNRLMNPSNSEETYQSGDIVIKAPMPENEKIKANIEIYRWNRNKWEQTMFSINRDDFCKAVFDPSELWYPAIESIPEDQRSCPPKTGTHYTLTNSSNHIVLKGVSIGDLAGKYKSISHISAGDWVVCITSKIVVERK